MTEVAAEQVSKIAADAAAQAEKALSDVAKRVETALRELRDKSRDYADVAGEGLETAQKYVVDRVQERPVAATLAALGVGVLIGFLLAGRKS
jgi:ElaB/YqjD/DUF883 family membrane-anchored ribosome-binding protein